MNQIIKDSLSGTLIKCGLELRRASSVPFGVHWHRDIQYFPNGAGLETIFDVGANIGQTAITAVKHFPKSRIYSFEPVPSTFQELVRKTARHARIEPICCAVGSSCGKANVTTAPLSVSNTLNVDAHSSSGAESLLEVKVETVDSFCAERCIQRVNLLKIDTEGYEMNVLKGAETLLTEKRIDFILVECDFIRRAGEPHGDFADIFKYVSVFGFHVVSFYTGGVDDLGWIWGDVLFREGSSSQSGRVANSPIARRR